MTVCKTVIPPYCHFDTGSGTVHLLISKEFIGKYRYHLRKEQGLKSNQFHKRYSMLPKDRNDNLIIKSYRSMLQVSTSHQMHQYNWHHFVIYLLQASSPFLAMFSITIYILYLVCQNAALCGNGLKAGIYITTPRSQV